MFCVNKVLIFTIRLPLLHLYPPQSVDHPVLNNRAVAVRQPAMTNAKTSTYQSPLSERKASNLPAPTDTLQDEVTECCTLQF